MIKQYYWLITAILLLTSLVACEDQDGLISSDEDIRVFSLSIPEPSDLCLSFSGNGLFTVSDQTGKVYEIGFDGQLIKTFDSFSGGDLEGICIDPATKNIFVVNERTHVVSRLDEDGRLIDQFTIPITTKKENDGIEGISLNDDIFYFVNQKNPCVLIMYNRNTKQWSEQIPLNFSEDVNAICYDDTSNVLWIVSSHSRKLFRCTLDGKPLQVLDIDFIQQPEGVWIDHRQNCAWICSDSDSKLYKVSLRNLTKY
jgi:uncharacterized protein YjiK